MNELNLHEISEANHRILNPLLPEQVDLLAEICRLRPGDRVLDLACGKAELLGQWARGHGIHGVGVDVSTVFVPAARARAEELLGVADRVEIVLADASTYEPDPHAFEVVACIGASWIGGGLPGTIALLDAAMRPDGLMLIGEPYWREPPPAAACEAIGCPPELFASLEGTLDRIEAASMQLVEMTLADETGWDRYVASQWWTTVEWLRSNADDPRVPDVAAFLENSRRTHLAWQRRYLGWGVFVLRH